MRLSSPRKRPARHVHPFRHHPQRFALDQPGLERIEVVAGSGWHRPPATPRPAPRSGRSATPRPPGICPAPAASSGCRSRSAPASYQCVPAWRWYCSRAMSKLLQQGLQAVAKAEVTERVQRHRQPDQHRQQDHFRLAADLKPPVPVAGRDQPHRRRPEQIDPRARSACRSTGATSSRRPPTRSTAARPTTAAKPAAPGRRCRERNGSGCDGRNGAPAAPRRTRTAGRSWRVAGRCPGSRLATAASSQPMASGL